MSATATAAPPRSPRGACAVAACGMSRVGGKPYCASHAASSSATVCWAETKEEKDDSGGLKPQAQAQAQAQAQGGAASSPAPHGKKACAVAGCGRQRSVRAYCGAHAAQEREHEAATKIKSFYKGFVARKSYDDLVIEKILLEEEQREREQRALDEERDRILEGIERKEIQRRDSVLSLSQRFSMDNVARVVQYAIRWRRKTRQAKIARSRAASPDVELDLDLGEAR